MNERLMRRYPSVADLARRARWRIPHFSWEYLDSGTGADDCLRRNREAFASVTLTPNFMRGPVEPDVQTSLFGMSYAVPFGVAPVGLTGLMWPGAERILARTAARFRMPYALSTVATQAPETIGRLTDGMGWFQLYPPRRVELRRDLLKRARDAGFTTLLVTVDVPTGSRRERQKRAGVDLPPRLTPALLYRCAVRPSWTIATLRAGKPRFAGLDKYLDTGDSRELLAFVRREFNFAVDWDYLRAVREEWDGPMAVKGVLDVAQACEAAALGVDGVVVSNHGGRQFDGAPAALSVLPAIAAAVGGRARVLLDSGVRSGLDIARALALGADFVLLGRAFMYGVAALGEQGGNHVAEILIDDLKNNMVQLGCRTPNELSQRLCSSAGR
ncbi:MAG: alpha-hydroxy acid oxidase [Gammaproteobacteria bacterium]